MAVLYFSYVADAGVGESADRGEWRDGSGDECGDECGDGTDDGIDDGTGDDNAFFAAGVKLNAESNQRLAASDNLDNFIHVND